MKHTTDQAIALISGFSFSTAYTLVYNVLGDINEMSTHQEEILSK